MNDVVPTPDVSFGPVAGVRWWEWMAGGVATALVVLAGVYEPKFHNDSWTFLELSDTVFGDFFRANTLRQFEIDTPYSTAFPPLWPVLIAVARRTVGDAGVYTATLLAGAASLALMGALVALVRRCGSAGWVGLVVYLSLLAHPYYQLDLKSGGTIPLSLLVATASAQLLVAGRVGLPGVVLMAVLCALGCLIRFDYSLAAALFGLVAVLHDGRPRWRPVVTRAVVGSIVGLAVLAPWIAYNQAHFGKPFATDNLRQVLLNHTPGDVLAYYDPLPPTLRTDPADWVKGLFTTKLFRIVRGVYITLDKSLLLAALLFALVTRPRPATGWVRTRHLALLSAAISLVYLFPAWVSGYGYASTRYYLLPLLLFTITLTHAWSGRLAELTGGRRAALVWLLAFVACHAAAPEQVITNKIDLTRPGKYRTPSVPSPKMVAVAQAVRADAHGEPYRVFVASGFDPVAFGALTGAETTAPPKLYGPFSGFVRQFGITHLYDPDDRLPASWREGLTLTPLPEPGLYRVAQKSAP